jgi:cell wall-associated NlpC family hydrolase
MSATVAAAPDADPVMKLLNEKGLLTPQAADAALAADPPAARKPGGLVDKVRDQASDMVLTAMNFLGVPYRRGGTDESTGFDCSGFTRHVFERSLGLVLPRRADEQASARGLLQVQRDELRPGDLVFFNTLRRTFSHVGIYVGDNKFIHSPRAGGQVRVEDMQMSYWRARFTGARRVDTSLAGDAGLGQR